MTDSTTHPSVLFALPSGLSLGGVTTWAVNLANELVRRGYRVGIIVHRPREGDSPATFEVDDRVKIFNLEHLPAMDAAAGMCQIFRIEYERAIDALGGLVVAIPAQMGDCHGTFAACTMTRASNLRIIGWAHLDSAYEIQVLSHYSRVLSRLVAVSAELERKVRSRIAHRSAHVAYLPYGVKVGRTKKRFPGDLIRIAYVGRLDRDVKRVHILPELSKRLIAANVFHGLHIAGDGPERVSVQSAADANHRIRMLGAIDQSEVRTLLGRADMIVLPSRAEGLPLVIQEAMERGCIPIACAEASGVSELIEDGVNGLLFSGAPDDTSLAESCARCIIRAMSLDREVLSANARATVVNRLDLKVTHSAMVSLIIQAAADPPRAWPHELNPMFTAKALAGSGTLPSDGPVRMRRVLAELKDSKVLLYGAGRHTTELLPILREFRDCIVGIVDDGARSPDGKVGDFAIISREEAKRINACHVVISSWIHQDDMWNRRAEFEQAGMKVHRIYTD